ncbi:MULTISPECIES: hypothetical protein [unclassified Streptomyces]|uniref:hypothetical protein n=1 Tax=unclassified Streptomyces TaxID=2593676 RepID=UPI000A53B1FD|nr:MULTISPECIES: hypothetical protein [unclassified Streptomyces]
MPTRTFTPDELDEIGVPFECDASDDSYAEELHSELYDTTRWAHVYAFVFRAPDDGKAYRVTYWTGATERQDQNLWNWEDRIPAVEVEEVQVMITGWQPVKEKS